MKKTIVLFVCSLVIVASPFGLSTGASALDVCAQDGSVPSQKIKFNPDSGAFTACVGGAPVVGVATVNHPDECLTTLNAPNLVLSYDACLNKVSAIVTKGGIFYHIVDSNTLDSNCSNCPGK